MSYTPRNANGQATMANSEPVVIASNQSAVPVSAASLPLPTGAATGAKQDTGNTSLASIDGKITAVNTGAVTISAALPAGTNAIGKLAANSGVIIGDVNVTTLPVAFNTGTRSATTQRVTVATDDVVQIADNGGSLTVDGTVSITANSAVNVAQMNGTTVTMGNGASGTGVQRVTLASDSTGQAAPSASATSTGLSMSYQNALGSTKVAVNASAGNLYGYHIYNPGTVITYVQLFNVASASVTLGTTTPNMVIAVPAGGWADAQLTVPISFGTALTVAATTTTTGSTGPATSLNANFFYK